MGTSSLMTEATSGQVSELRGQAQDAETELPEETWQWLAFEQALQSRGVQWAHVRPAGLFANALAGGYPITGAWWATCARDGEPLWEFRPHVPVPFIDEADAAAVIARVLTTGGFKGQMADISGAVTSAAGRAHQLGQVIGRPVQLAELETEDDARERWRDQGWPEVTIETTLWIARHYAANLDRNLMALTGQQERPSASPAGPPGPSLTGLPRTPPASSHSLSSPVTKRGRGARSGSGQRPRCPGKSARACHSG